MARISPVCGFITIVTPCCSPAARMPHCSDCVAMRCIRASMVEHQVLARLRLLQRPDRLQWTALRVALLQLGAIGAPQLLLEGGLDPGAANQVIAQVAVVLQVAELLQVDRPDVAEHVG